MNKGRKRWPPIVKWLIAFPFVLLIPLAILYAGFGPADIGPASRDLDRAIQQYRATGWPWTAQDLEPLPPKPGENAAPLLDEAGQLFKKDQRAAGNAVWSDIRHARWAKVKPLLPRFERELELCEQAVKRPRFYYLHDPDATVSESFPEYAPVHQFIRLLDARAVIRAEEGDGKGAATDLDDAWRLALMMGQQTQISLLSELNGMSDTLDSYARCAAALNTNRSGLQVLQASLSPKHVSPDLKRALQYDAYEGIAMCRNLDLLGGIRFIRAISGNGSYEDLPSPKASELRRDGPPPGMMAQAFLDTHLRFWTEAARYVDAHPSDYLSWGKHLDAQQLKLQSSPYLSSMFAKAQLPVYAFTSQATVEEVARCAATKALLAALLARIETGKMPQTIAQIPGKWIDPITGKPLRVKAGKDTIRVYSVGADGKDNGGVGRYEGASLASPRVQYDVVAAFPPLPPSGL